ncbi:transcriptional regulator family: Fungal Specific TF [Penicillium hispanicum]|uniref:transcriptional regulator family: Fungal Specific TF n=1 Tax=Penicillium hispanicum TaxID=1080232 RepID=UPI0025407340|nr:transcriptional regulator family: Fungal Specific TF [Penicillium hispanicum]KAJ5587099.1 transcriptional regulator family: Fungal Specific TF [Penicillium hispanicum]
MPNKDLKTKIRPQQSCLKCRERKVKCDRSIPCHACIIRGLEAECTYLTTAEDRAHISQAEIIDRLRREVAQLRGQLAQGPRKPSPIRSRSRNPAFYARAGAGLGSGPGPGPGSGNVVRATSAGAGAAEITADGSWASSSSPSSSTTTMTNSMTVTSPESTGSECSAPAQSYSSQEAYSTSKGGNATQIAEVDVSPPAVFGSNPIDDTATASFCHTGGIDTFAPGETPASISMHGLPSYSMPAPDGTLGVPQMHTYTGDDPNIFAFDDGGSAHSYAAGDSANFSSLYFDEHSNANEKPQPYSPAWGQGHDAVGHQFPARMFPNPSYYSSPSVLGTFTNAGSYANLQISNPEPIPEGSLDQVANVSQETFPLKPTDSISSSWKGEGKQELLETLLETIGSCDEERVAQVVQVVRASATPEEAVSGICQVLGIGGDGR